MINNNLLLAYCSNNEEFQDLIFFLKSYTKVTLSEKTEERYKSCITKDACVLCFKKDNKIEIRSGTNFKDYLGLYTMMPAKLYKEYIVTTDHLPIRKTKYLFDE